MNVENATPSTPELDPTMIPAVETPVDVALATSADEVVIEPPVESAVAEPVVAAAEQSGADEGEALAVEHGESAEVAEVAEAAETPEAAEAVETAEAVEAAAEPVEAGPPPSNKHWYVVKVQSGREESIKESVERKVKIEGLEEYYGQIVIPVEKVVEMRGSKRVTRERKLYPGYLMVEVEFNDRILYLFRETSGVGDFVGAGVNRPPVPMTPREVERMLHKAPGKEEEQHKVLPGKPPVDRGDRVKVKDGTFAGMEGEVKEIIEAKNQVRVALLIFGREVPVDLEYWQVEPV